MFKNKLWFHFDKLQKNQDLKENIKIKPRYCEAVLKKKLIV